ncbi:MAG: Uma2 family endonuclease [Chloroflexota bacterium]|nr:Uma2 family endonuclease [Chloroflexota bacterium]
MTLYARVTEVEKSYSPQEFETLPEFDERYELVDGKLVKKPMPGGQHGSIARRINKRVNLFDPDDKFGIMWFDTTFDVGTGWLPIPDLGYVVTSRIPAITEKAIKCVPDLVVEIHSPSDSRSKAEREATEKKIRDWQKVGVSIIWAINPETKMVAVYHPHPAEPIMELGLEDELNGEAVIPGFKLRVGELFG